MLVFGPLFRLRNTYDLGQEMEIIMSVNLKVMSYLIFLFELHHIHHFAPSRHADYIGIRKMLGYGLQTPFSKKGLTHFGAEFEVKSPVPLLI